MKSPNTPIATENPKPYFAHLLSRFQHKKEIRASDLSGSVTDKRVYLQVEATMEESCVKRIRGTSHKVRSRITESLLSTAENKTQTASFGKRELIWSCEGIGLTNDDKSGESP